MGNAHYTLPDGREAGYGVAATCDRPECDATVYRGLDALCGELPAPRPTLWGCGDYFCDTHRHRHDCPRPQCPEWSEEIGRSCVLAEGHEDPCRDVDGHSWTPETAEVTP